MKKVKGILASLVICTVLLGSVGTLWANLQNNGESTVGMFITQEAPDPRRD